MKSALVQIWASERGECTFKFTARGTTNSEMRVTLSKYNPRRVERVRTNMKEKGLNHGLPEIGYFVDWDGNVRRVEAPGGGFSCKVVRHAYYLGVDVMDSEGFVIFDAVYYSSMAELRELGVTASLHEEAVG